MRAGTVATLFDAFCSLLIFPDLARSAAAPTTCLISYSSLLLLLPVDSTVVEPDVDSHSFSGPGTSRH